MALQSLLSGISAWTIQWIGEELTFTRPSDGTTRNVVCNPQAYSPNNATAMQIEGLNNMADPTPYIFLCPVGSDVKVNDQTIFQGSAWRIATNEPERINGGDLMLNCLALKIR